MKSPKPSAAIVLSFVSSIEVILRCLWNTPGLARADGKPAAGLPVLFSSPPGAGKSSRIEGAARDGGFHCETVITSLCDPTEFGGLPFQSAGGVMRRAPAEWAVKAAEYEHAVVFLDEINGGAQAVQMALMRVILSGVVGDLMLPNTVRFVAAMNGTEDCPGRWDIDAALANRFIILPWPRVEAKGWGDWLRGVMATATEPLDPAEEYERVMKGWPSVWSDVRGWVAAFIERRPDLLLVMPEAGSPEASGAWPSPRSWEMGARAYAGAILHGLPEQDADALLAGAVGSSAALEFASWRKHLDLPSAADVLDGKVKLAHDRTRPDRTMAVLSSCTALLLDPTCARRKERAEVMVQTWGACLDQGAQDMAVLAYQSVMRSKEHRGVVMGSPSFVKVSSRMEPFTAASGMKAGA